MDGRKESDCLVALKAAVMQADQGNGTERGGPFSRAQQAFTAEPFGIRKTSFWLR